MKYFSITLTVKIGVLESSREEAEITAAQRLKDAIANLPHGARKIACYCHRFGGYDDNT